MRARCFVLQEQDRWVIFELDIASICSPHLAEWLPDAANPASYLRPADTAPREGKPVRASLETGQAPEARHVLEHVPPTLPIHELPSLKVGEDARHVLPAAAT
jgi:hypothetical protein